MGSIADRSGKGGGDKILWKKEKKLGKNVPNPDEMGGLTKQMTQTRRKKRETEKKEKTESQSQKKKRAGGKEMGGSAPGVKEHACWVKKKKCVSWGGDLKQKKKSGGSQGGQRGKKDSGNRNGESNKREKEIGGEVEKWGGKNGVGWKGTRRWRGRETGKGGGDGEWERRNEGGVRRGCDVMWG